MKVWEATRKPRVIVLPDAFIMDVRARMRDNEEGIAVIINDPIEEKVVGYLTRREIIQVTSHHTNLRAKDLALDYPVVTQDADIDEAYKLLVEHKVDYMPVVESKNNPKLVGVIGLVDIVRALLAAGYEPIAETVAEVMTTDDLDKYLTTPDEPITKVWSDFVYRGIKGKVVIRSKEEPYPVGMISLKELVESGRWFFHRESERGLKSVAKVRRLMVRGAVVATPETPISYVAKVMVENEFPVIPVVDEQGRVIGVVTIEDVARAYLVGAKPGRVKPAKKAALPKPVAPEEKVTYVSRESVLEQVLVAKPAVEELIGVRAADIMRTEMPAISINDTVEHARREMIRRKTNYLLVVDEKGSIVGVVSKWAMLRALGLKGPIWRRRIHDRMFIDYVMDTDIPRVSPDASIEEVAAEMVRKGAEVAFVVDEKGNIIGFVTKDDIVDAYARTQIGRALVENVMTPGRIGIVHPHHSLYHVVQKMKNFYLDALTVYDGSRVIGVVSANRLPFVALEDATTGMKSRRLVWVRKLVRSAARKGRYVKVLPLLAIDVTVPLNVSVSPKDDVVKAIELMKEYNVDGIPVVDEEGRVLGVICKNDILRELARTARLRKAVAAMAEKEESKETRETTESSQAKAQ
ncbi:CBS domain containing protein [Pyrolobus fumarii 1A]|uniref:CBS domain containing protein n=1 Tax=Pyrolobus fumarii (strain DSM 11204 / 1A) TaxID=694429 RepID=G0EEV9_PYRF1|nr:CBS domain-containing protein [Pyrolobus fumarii]AEM38073.1 CBS domain containing protein [Pyrolobus fumarii 1A]